MKKGDFQTTKIIKCENPECNCDHGFGLGMAVVNLRKQKDIENKKITTLSCCKKCAYSPFAKEKRLQKSQKTCQEKYGVNNVAQHAPIKNKTKTKRENTFLDKYGVKHPLQVEEFAKKSATARQKTFLEKYGEGVKCPFHVPEFKEKAVKTNIERHGDHPMRVEVLKQKNLINMLNTKLERYGQIFPHTNGFSKVATDLFDEIVQILNVKDAFYGKNEQTIIFEKEHKTYKVDFLYNNKVIEFYGDYWHCNPEIFSENTKLRGNRNWHKIHEKDKTRENVIKTQYELLIIWENELYTNKQDVINRCTSFLCA